MNNFTGNTGQGPLTPLPGMPILPPGVLAGQQKPASGGPSRASNISGAALSKGELKKALQQLTQVSYDMESTGKSLSMTKNMVQHSQLSEKMDRLAKEQAQLIKRIADTSHDEKLKKAFVRESQIIGDYQQKIRNSKSREEIEVLQKQIDAAADKWVGIFKEIAMDAIKSSKP